MIPFLTMPALDAAFAGPGMAFGAALSQRLARRWAMRQAKRAKKPEPVDILPFDDEYAPAPQGDPLASTPLLEALDRLRATGGVPAQEPSTGRLLRARKAYQEQTTRVFLNP